MANKRLSGPQSCAHFSWTANLAARLSRFNRTSRGIIFPPKRIQKPLFPERSQQLFHQDFQIEPWCMNKIMSWFLNINRSPSFSRHTSYIYHFDKYKYATNLYLTRSQPGWVTSPPLMAGKRWWWTDPKTTDLEKWCWRSGPSPSGVGSVVRGGSSSLIVVGPWDPKWPDGGWLSFGGIWGLPNGLL